MMGLTQRCWPSDQTTRIHHSVAGLRQAVEHAVAAVLVGRRRWWLDGSAAVLGQQAELALRSGAWELGHGIDEA